MAVSDPTMMYGLLYKCISQNESYTSCIVNKKYNIETLLFTYTNEALNSQKQLFEVSKDTEYFHNRYVNFINQHKYIIIILESEINNITNINIDIKFYQNHPSEKIIKNYLMNFINTKFIVESIKWF